MFTQTQNSSVPLPERLSSVGESRPVPEVDTRIMTSGDTSTLAPLIHRLDSLLMVLKTCIGRQCTHPWEGLFPSGGVTSLSDALDAKFDEFFEQRIERVRFDKCEKGYIIESEGPMWSGQKGYAMTEEVSYE